MASLILGLLIMSVLAALLAALIETAHAFLADYGECRISINDGVKEFTVRGGGKLLSTLMDQGLFIPSACGGRGSCGLCKVQVRSGGGPLLPTETPYLDAEEERRGVRLACQVRVRTDLEIQIPEEFFLIKQFTARVAGLRPLTHNIKEVRLALLDPPEIQFKPGQFIQFQVPEYPGCPEPVYRAYSIASPPHEKNEITLVVTRVERGLATTYIHTILKEGDTVSFNGPYGEFYLRHSSRDVVMLGTGSGLAPLLSILRTMVLEKIDRKTTLFFGVRCRADLFYLDEITDIQKQLPRFSFIPVLSHPDPDDQWDGETGYVTDAAQRHLPEGLDAEAYLCGNPFMIKTAVELLKEKGIPEELIFYDKFA